MNCLCSFERRDRGFESHSRHGCLCFCFSVCRQRPCDGLIPHPRSTTYSVSFPSALQLRVSFGLLNNLPPFFSSLHLSSPSFHFHFTDMIMYILQPSQPRPSSLPCIYFILDADYLVSQQFNIYGVRLLASRPTPNLEDQGIPLHLAPTP
jgi:hypothetical protein